MKDLIAKLQLDANCALGAIWMHIDAQAAHIAELEAQIAASADTDKLREALTDAQIEDIAIDTGASGWIIVFAREIEKRVLASTALQAPVREVPEESAPKEGEKGWRPACCDGGGEGSPCCDYGGCAANDELAEMRAAAPVQEPKP